MSNAFDGITLLDDLNRRSQLETVETFSKTASIPPQKLAFLEGWTDRRIAELQHSLQGGYGGLSITIGVGALTSSVILVFFTWLFDLEYSPIDPVLGLLATSVYILIVIGLATSTLVKMFIVERAIKRLSRARTRFAAQHL